MHKTAEYYIRRNENSCATYRISWWIVTNDNNKRESASCTQSISSQLRSWCTFTKPLSCLSYTLGLDVATRQNRWASWAAPNRLLTRNSHTLRPVRVPIQLYRDSWTYYAGKGCLVQQLSPVAVYLLLSGSRLLRQVVTLWRTTDYASCPHHVCYLLYVFITWKDEALHKDIRIRKEADFNRHFRAYE